jgi:tetratricopeptide (TPR) repeat protein
VPEDIRHPLSSQELVLFDAVRLFVERAVTIAPGFVVTSENAPAVAQVCQRLDGIPLAIELAAARAKVLAVEQIAARLDDRFRLLTGGSAVALPRHQTLRAAIDWSYGLLSHQERTVLNSLSVFAGGWTLEAAEAICAGGSIEASDILDLLTQLVDKSLVGVSMRGSEARYRLLETVREYGREKLQEAADVAELRRRHFDWYLALAETAEPELYGPHEDVWGDRLELELDNLRAALDWGMMNAAHEEAVLRLAGALGSFWNKRTHIGEGRAWLERALPGRGATAGVRAKALGFAGVLARLQGDYSHAAVLGRESLDLRLKSEDKRGIAVALLQLGVLADYRGDPAEAKRLFAEAFAHFRKVGDKWGISSVLNLLGEVARAAGDYDAARSFYEKSLSTSREAGNSSGIANAVGNLGAVSLHQGNHMEAATLLRSALVLQRRLGDRKNIIACLAGLAAVAIAESKPEWAARLLGAAEALRERIGVLIGPADRVLYEHQIGFARNSLSEEAFASAWTEGRAMTLEQAIEYALSVEAD